MIICFECSASAKKTMDKLIENGSYADYSQLIMTAVDNLYMLHREIGPKGALIIGEGTELEQTSMQGLLDQGLRHDLFAPNAESKSSSRAGGVLPGLFGRPSVALPPFDLFQLPAERWKQEDKIPLDEWLFAMYNKLLPAKANCRALAYMMEEYKGGVPLSKAASTIADAAVKLGNYLLKLDEVKQTKRDDAYSTAFPSSNDKSDKSKNRYANQFIANVRKNGELSGILFSLKFINFIPSKDPIIGLTGPGWEFAYLGNPVLDGVKDRSVWKFSSDEIDFMLKHIAAHVPAERYAYQSIINIISGGHNTPESVDAALRNLAAPIGKRNFDDSFLSSYRAGAISRMADLGLIERVRNGIFVTYNLTDIAGEISREWNHEK